MKRVLYLLLMVWIALQSTLVQAHMVEESLHQLSHLAQTGQVDTADADQDEPCSVVVCSHPVGAFYAGAKFTWSVGSFSPASTVLPLLANHAVHEIERPKWPSTALGVAGI